MQLNKPDQTGVPEYTLLNDDNYIVFIKQEHDEGADSPMESDDSFGTFHSLCTKHLSYRRDCARLLTNASVWRDDDPFDASGSLIYGGTDAVPLSYFEHGVGIWSVYGEGPTCQFDSVQFAGVWEPSAMTVEAANHKGLTGESRYEWLAGIARVECKTWTAWCNGYVYYCAASMYVTRLVDDAVSTDIDDYKHRVDLLEGDGSYGGLFGDPDMVSYMEDAGSLVKGVLDDLPVDKPGFTVGKLIEVLERAEESNGADSSIVLDISGMDMDVVLMSTGYKDGTGNPVRLKGWVKPEQTKLAIGEGI